MVNKIPQLWIDALDSDPSFMETLLTKDKEIMFNFAIASNAIKNGKYRNNPRAQRQKLKATKNDFIDIFLYQYLKRKNTVIKIKNKLIMEYHSNFKRTKNNEYETIMKELNIILGINESESKPKCNCRNKGFGFCFCINK